MAWNGLILTNDGRMALTKAQIDGRMHIKSIVVGDGAAPQNFPTQKKLVHELYEISEVKVIQTNDGCLVIGDFPEVDYDYYFRELGVMVNTDEGDKLYVYDNCGSDAMHIVVSTGVEHRESRLRIKLVFADVAEVTTTMESILYVDYKTFEEATAKIGHVIIGAEDMALGAYDTLFVVDDPTPDTTRFGGASYSNMEFSNAPPAAGENWAQLPGTDVLAVRAVSEEPSSDAAFFAEVN